MPLIRIVSIVAYLIVVGLLIRWVNKITRDTQTILWSLSVSINKYFLRINTYIATHRDQLEKFDDLIDVVYAKKKWFIHNKTHWLTDWYELFVWLKDDINYLSDYTGEDIDNTDLNKQTDAFFAFLFHIRSWQRSLRFILGVITLGIGLGFVHEQFKL